MKCTRSNMNDYDKDYLVHHGILGQKWGQQNGPPYPLDKSQKTVAELKNAARTAISVVKNKKKQIQRNQNLKKARKAREEESERKDLVKKLSTKGSSSEILKNIDKIKVSEYDDIIRRLEFEKKIKDINDDRTKKASETTRSILDTVGKVGATTASVVTAYNNFASAYNTFLAGKNNHKELKRVDIRLPNEDKK